MGEMIFLDRYTDSKKPIKINTTDNITMNHLRVDLDFATLTLSCTRNLSPNA
jgi:hypothetical protein